MSSENTTEYRIVKLHPHLEGKHILFIDTSDVNAMNIPWIRRLKLEKVTQTHSKELFDQGSLLDYMNNHRIDALVIHMEALPDWIQQCLEVIESQKPVVILQGVRADNDSNVLYRWFYDLKLPVVLKGIDDFYERVLNGLEAQFAANE